MSYPGQLFLRVVRLRFWQGEGSLLLWRGEDHGDDDDDGDDFFVEMMMIGSWRY